VSDDRCLRCGSTSLYQSGKCRSCAGAKGNVRCKTPLSERVMHRIAIHPETGCWLWLGRPTSWGYGRATDRGQYVFVHRYFYELIHNNGKRLSPSIHVHHECEERRCCNPQHLRALERGDHSRHHGSFAKAVAANAIRQRAQTHCKRGHEFTPENTHVNKRGSRVCRECSRARFREQYRRLGGWTHKSRPAPLALRRADAEESAKPQKARSR
jgi:hypothetical protein